MADYNYLSDGRPAGTVLGNSASDLIGFFGTAPADQRSGSTQVALTLTTATSGGYGFASATAFNAFTAQLEEIRATLAELGLFKGAA